VTAGRAEPTMEDAFIHLIEAVDRKLDAAPGGVPA